MAPPLPETCPGHHPECDGVGRSRYPGMHRCRSPLVALDRSRFVQLMTSRAEVPLTSVMSSFLAFAIVQIGMLGPWGLGQSGVSALGAQKCGPSRGAEPEAIEEEEVPFRPHRPPSRSGLWQFKKLFRVLGGAVFRHSLEEPKFTQGPIPGRELL